MAKIYIGFSYPKEFKIGAKLISVWMNRPYSHVYVRFDAGKVPSNVYHAAHGMVHFRLFENFKKDNNVVKEYEIEVSEETRLSLLIECMQLAAEPYGVKELFKIFALDVVYSLANKELSMGDSRGYICSELVGKLCQDKLGIKFNKPLHLLKPSHVDTETEKMKFKRSV